jgi:hypothetical protein
MNIKHDTWEEKFMKERLGIILENKSSNLLFLK